MQVFPQKLAYSKAVSYFCTLLKEPLLPILTNLATAFIQHSGSNSRLS